MKTLFIIDTLKTGGAEKSILQISALFKQFEPVVCVVYKGDDLSSLFKKKNIPVIFLNINGRYSFLEAIRAFKKIVKQEQPDIIHATLFRSEIIARFVASSLKIPLVCSFVNDSYSAERYKFLSFFGKLKLNAFKLLDRFTAGKSDHFISITHAIINNNCEALHINPKEVSVIYRGRTVNDLHAGVFDSKIREIRSQYGDGAIFLTVARLLLRKGYVESIKAFSLLCKDYPTAKYLIAGEGHDRPIFERLIRELHLEKNVFLLGNRSDVPSLLAASDFFVFPSHYEGQGGALIEAMLFAKPIIASRIAVVEESIQDAFSGLLFALHDEQDLYSKMKIMLGNRDNAHTLGLHAKEEALQKFDIHTIASRHEIIYAEVIRKSHTRK